MPEQKPPKFYIEVTSDGWSLDLDDIWPDGDAPENPTASDVVTKMRECGTTSRIILEWNLQPRIVVVGPKGDSAEVTS